jgi:hypothetical protein
MLTAAMPGLRLDHFLLNKKVVKRLADARVDKHVRGWKHASDHAPVWIELADKDLPEKKSTGKKVIGMQPKETRKFGSLIENRAQSENARQAAAYEGYACARTF